MAKIKIYEIAKELKIDNKDVLEAAKKMGLKVTSHLSGIEENDVKRLKENLKKSEKDIKPEKMEKKSKTEKKDEIKTTGQIIIRREVIVEDKKQETNKNQKNGIGFNVQRRNKDFNIVYREKPTKPMTVNELFGIKPKVAKKEEPKVEEKKKVENKVESVATEKVETPKQPEIKETVNKEPGIKANNEKINNETKTISKEVKAMETTSEIIEDSETTTLKMANLETETITLDLTKKAQETLEIITIMVHLSKEISNKDLQIIDLSTKTLKILYLLILWKKTIKEITAQKLLTNKKLIEI